MEDSSSPAKIHYTTKFPKGYCWDSDDEDCDESQLKDPETLTAADCGCPEAKFGDIINAGEYRSTNAFIIGKGGKLVRNPDNSKAGYLSIPYEITQYLTHAHAMYEGIEDLLDVDLRHDDEFLRTWFGDIPEEFRSCKFNWFYPTGILAVTFPTSSRKEFKQETNTLEDVMRAYELCQPTTNT